MDLVIFDLETTGLSPRFNEIIQIAAIRMRHGEPLAEERFETFVCPQTRIPGFITSLTGISNEDVRGAPPCLEAVQSFSAFVGTATLVAHNGRRFDLPFIREFCERQQLPLREVPFFDSMQLSRKLWGGRGGHGLDAVLERTGVSAQGIRRHDARGDVHVLAQAVRHMWTRLDSPFDRCPVDLGVGLLPAHTPCA